MSEGRGEGVSDIAALRMEIESRKLELSGLPKPISFSPVKIGNFVDLVFGGISPGLDRNVWIFGQIQHFVRDGDAVQQLDQNKKEVLAEANKEVLSLLQGFFLKYNQVETEQLEYNHSAEDYIKKRKEELEDEIESLIEEYLSRHKWIDKKLNQLGLSLNWYFYRDDIGKIPGVYILCSENGIDYIGQSQDIRVRLNRQHHAFDENIHAIGVVEVAKKKKRLRLERSLITLFNPEMNQKHVYPKSQGSFFERVRLWE